MWSALASVGSKFASASSCTPTTTGVVLLLTGMSSSTFTVTAVVSTTLSPSASRRQECARQVQRKRLAVVVRRRVRQVINLVQQREREVGAVRLKLEHQTVRAVHNVVVVGVHIANDRPVQDPVLDRRTLRRHGHVARRHNRRADNRARLPSRRKIERERRRLVRPNRHRRRQRRRRDLRREGLAALVVARRAKDVVRIGIGRVEVRQRVLLHPNHNRRRVVVDRNVVLDIHRHRRRQHHAVAVGIRRQECARQVQRKRLAVVVRRRVRQVINLVQQREREVGAVRLKLEHQTVRAVHNVVVVGVHIANDRPVQDPVLDRRTLRRHGHVARRHNRRADNRARLPSRRKIERERRRLVRPQPTPSASAPPP